MTERPSSDHSDTPRPEVSAFLHDRAGALERDAAPVGAEEAARREVIAATAPHRQWRSMFTPSAVRTSPRSALAAAAVIALVLGSVGGFAFGRASAPKHATVATAASPDEQVSDSGAPMTTISPEAGMATAPGWYTYGGPPMTRVFDRTTSEGIDIHAFTQDQTQLYAEGRCAAGAECASAAAVPPPVPACPANEFCPPPECFATSFMVELANDGAVGQTGAGVYPLHDVAVVTSPFAFGQAEGSPAVGWIVNTGDQVAQVQATWGDGFVDSMAPASGWAVVAHNGSHTDVTITVADGSGAVLETFTPDEFTYQQPPPECVPPPPPPPELPPAGTEQPDDVAAATQGVRDAYESVFTHGSDPEHNATLMEDPDTVQAALGTTKANFPEAADSVTIEVGEIRFLSQTEAALFFELKYTGGALFGKQIGYAKLIDGTWKISRDTLCMVAGWGGGQCDPPPDPSRASTAPSSPN
jgi:hypothetical protein